MAMQNIYNYKKPQNYYAQINSAKAQEARIHSAQPEKRSGSGTGYGSGDQYLEQKILTAKPEELTLMLYDGVVRFLKQAQLFNTQKDIEKTNNALIRAQDIIDELNVTLNMEYEISRNLRSLYVFMKTRMVEANVKKSSEIMEELIDLATDMRDTWKEAMGLARSSEQTAE